MLSDIVTCVLIYLFQWIPLLFQVGYLLATAIKSFVTEYAEQCPIRVLTSIRLFPPGFGSQAPAASISTFATDYEAVSVPSVRQSQMRKLADPDMLQRSRVSPSITGSPPLPFITTHPRHILPRFRP